MSQKQTAPLVGIAMGSRSDWDIMAHASEVLDSFGVPHESVVLSAHRTPERMFSYGKEAIGRGLQVLIAGAGGAAHLPGMLASATTLPVLGVPVARADSMLRGMDALLSIVQMPRGVPVPTLAIGVPGATNAGLSAVAILALRDPDLQRQLEQYREEQRARIAEETLP